jgi:hypothetical protein
MKNQSFKLSGRILMFRNVLYLSFFTISFFLSQNASGQMVALLESDHDFLRTENGQFRTVFIIEAEKEAYNQVVAIAATMPETFTFTTDKIKKNKYQFSILFTHPTDPSYVKKVFLRLGIEQLKVNNKLFKLPDYEPVAE